MKNNEPTKTWTNTRELWVSLWHGNESTGDTRLAKGATLKYVNSSDKGTIFETGDGRIVGIDFDQYQYVTESR